MSSTDSYLKFRLGLVGLALLASACATTPETHKAQTIATPEVSVTVENDGGDVLADSFEILPEIETGNGAIQGDLEFLNTAEGDLFDAVLSC